MSAVAGAEAAAYAEVPLIHVEAGMRSHNTDDPEPEEKLRIEIAQWADINIPATATARDNLLHEGIPGIVTPPTGNTGITTFLSSYVEDGSYRGPWVGPALVTLHRRELREDPNYENIIRALNIVDSSKFFWSWPVHPAMHKTVARLVDIHLTLPVPFAHMQRLLRKGDIKGILTDSGGLVEEAATCGIPTAIVRNHNDRPEAVQAGYAKRFDRTPEGIRQAITAIQDKTILSPNPTPFPYGTADSALNCAKTIMENLK